MSSVFILDNSLSSICALNDTKILDTERRVGFGHHVSGPGWLFLVVYIVVSVDFPTEEKPGKREGFSDWYCRQAIQQNPLNYFTRNIIMSKYSHSNLQNDMV